MGPHLTVLPELHAVNNRYDDFIGNRDARCRNAAEIHLR
jgi:hypothetical protein